MMIGNKWECTPDDDRETWCFLTIELGAAGECNGKPIASWQAGYGNQKRMTRILNSNGHNEKEIVEELLKEIRFCRHKGTTLITFGADAIPTIRTRILIHRLDGASLQSIKNICLEELLKKYLVGFDKLKDIRDISAILKPIEDSSVKPDDFLGVQTLRGIFMAIGSMLPRSCFRIS